MATPLDGQQQDCTCRQSNTVMSHKKWQKQCCEVLKHQPLILAMADRVDCVQNHPTGQRHTKIHVYALPKGNLEVKLPTTRRDGKAEVGRVKEEEEEKERRSEKRTSQKKEDAGGLKSWKKTFHCVCSIGFWLRRVEKLAR